MPRSRRPQRRRKSSSARSAGNISQIPPAGLRGPVRIGGRRTRRWLFLAAAGVLAIAIIISFFLPQILDLAPDLGRGTDEYKGGVGEVQARMTVPEDTLIGPGRVLAAGSEDARHDLLEWPEYSTSPPTSGPHLSFTWPCDFYNVDYTDPVTEQVGVPDRRIVHNMEHGHVVMSYNLPDQEDVERLQQVHLSLSDHGLWLITRPYDKIEEGTVAMTAWGVLDVFDGVNEQRINAFYDAYKGNRFSGETQTAGRGIPC